ncbi:flagellar hook-basal body complex protein FliE [Anoxybacillus kestanbolensis]|uniref:flagellar hook-basal body complex protein FliE n=1 Tax=Anoxybacillus kestanbolensis TaxID=227476 RepID=UPI003D214725
MINRIQRAALSPAVQQQTIKPAEAQRAFSQFLKEAIQEVNKQQIQSDQLTMKLARGENVDLHNVMIASQKASVSLQLAIEVRNKVIEAYQEVMRMQV